MYTITLSFTGREEALKVSPKHTVLKSTTVPPFPDGIEHAMFGEFLSLRILL